tara:strand:+ start:279 stop:647 length:369 start_codon:yes stop_codon:yes gene_type:complete
MRKPDLRDPETFDRAVRVMMILEPDAVKYWRGYLTDKARGELVESQFVALARSLDYHWAGGFGKKERPGLCFTNPADDQDVQMAFGYFNGEATAAVFRGSDKAPIMIPREVLQIALEQGWGE